MKLFKLLALSLSAVLLAACGAKTPYDYSALQESKPRSVLVLMPTDQTTEVKAGAAVLSNITAPLAEAGYYVFPSALVYETFKHNGLTQAQDIHNVKLDKIKSIFGADAVLYIDVENYGVSYQIINSVTRVSMNAKLVDTKTGKTLWTGKGYASVDSSDNNSGLLGSLIKAAVSQVMNHINDKSYDVAGFASWNLLSTGQSPNILYGPYHPNYGRDPQLNKTK